MADNRSVTEKIKDELIPSLASGVVGILGASFLLGVDLSMDINIANMTVPAWAAIGGVITGADLIAYASHDFVLEKLPALQSFATYENRLLAPVLSGVGTYGLLFTAISSDTSLMNSFLLGAGSSVTGRYAFDTFKETNM
jgi:hypothetical protein